MEDELDLTNAHLKDDALRQIPFPETLKVRFQFQNVSSSYSRHRGRD